MVKRNLLKYKSLVSQISLDLNLSETVVKDVIYDFSKKVINHLKITSLLEENLVYVHPLGIIQSKIVNVNTLREGVNVKLIINRNNKKIIQNG